VKAPAGCHAGNNNKGDGHTLCADDITTKLAEFNAATSHKDYMVRDSLSDAGGAPPWGYA
jgi:hypothetical protein